MFQRLVNRNDDLARLVTKGYAVAVDSNHLVVRDIPYLDLEGNLQWGALVAKLEFVDQERVTQTDHQVFFAGSEPHGLDGKPIPNLGGGGAGIVLSEACRDVVVRRSFSNKPRGTGKFADFFDKIESYVGVVSGPAKAKYKDASPLTFKAGKEVAVLNPMFKFHDTLTSRADITDLTSRFKDEVVAVVGLGGTGAYVLDFLVKTPVREIRAFDGDGFHVHNAYRSPGRLGEDELGRSKTDVYGSRYENFRHGLTVVSKFLDASCAEDVRGVTFAFICVDKGSARASVIDLLLANGIPFIDVGMGLKRRGGPLNGMLRTTYYSKDDGQAVKAMGLADLVDTPADEYHKNIQISELNALNAAIAVMKYKQALGFYRDDAKYYHAVLEIGDMKIVGLP